MPIECVKFDRSAMLCVEACNCSNKDGTVKTAQSFCFHFYCIYLLSFFFSFFWDFYTTRWIVIPLSPSYTTSSQKNLTSNWDTILPNSNLGFGGPRIHVWVWQIQTEDAHSWLKNYCCFVFCIKEILGGGGGFGLLLPLPQGLIPRLSWGNHALASKLTGESVVSIEFVPPFSFSFNFSFPLSWRTSVHLFSYIHDPNQLQTTGDKSTANVTIFRPNTDKGWW